VNRPQEGPLTGHDVSLIREPALWLRNTLRHMWGRPRDFELIERLLEHHEGRYVLVPLQAAADPQLGTPGLGWTRERLIGEVMHAFARQAPGTARLVFKTHPVERGQSAAHSHVGELAARLRIAQRVHVIETGSLNLLIRHAAGVITVNSSAGFSAIFHGTPLLVLGEAIYGHPVLATCARGEPRFAAIWGGGHVAEVRLRHRYIDWIRHEALVPGDFYAEDGFRLACAGVLARLRAMPYPAAQELRMGEPGGGFRLPAYLNAIERYAS
jgi:capsular polysaccharide export protein